MFRRQDPEFHDRALEWGGGFIAGGHNCGQGSSREHAALAPLHLGIRAIVAKSFARIHRRNLIGQGILPLVFANETDYKRVSQGDSWKIESAREVVASGETKLVAKSGAETEIELQVRLLPREREILLAGGMLKYLQAEVRTQSNSSKATAPRLNRGDPSLATDRRETGQTCWSRSRTREWGTIGL